MKSSTESRNPHAHLFIIRVWAEKLEDEGFEWRGKVQGVSAAAGIYFRGWLALGEILQTLVTEGDPEE
jgi:hypothetical protein